MARFLASVSPPAVTEGLQSPLLPFNSFIGRFPGKISIFLKNFCSHQESYKICFPAYNRSIMRPEGPVFGGALGNVGQDMHTEKRESPRKGGFPLMFASLSMKRNRRRALSPGAGRSDRRRPVFPQRPGRRSPPASRRRPGRQSPGAWPGAAGRSEFRAS